MFSVGIITASDKGARGERIDESSKVIEKIVTENGYEVRRYKMVPDEREVISKTIVEMAEEVDLIFTTGGTGFSPRDWTPEATRDVIDREVPGISEFMRSQSMKVTPKAMLSRGISGIRKKCLIINLPGSPKAVKENLTCVIPALEHGILILKGEAGECGASV